MLDYHRSLLTDETRTSAFREAIRRVVTPDDVVLDLGSGSGILAFLAAEAGARRVFAIERGHMADAIALMARHLGFADRVQVFHEYSTKVELPARATVLVTETIGSFGPEEQIVSLVIDARARLLHENATIIPRRIEHSVVPVELPELHAKHIAWWSEPRYGFDFSPLRVFASNHLITGDIAPSAHLAAPCAVLDVDLLTVNDANVRGQAAFEATRDGTLHGFGAWFDATLIDGITLSNSAVGATVWQQSFLPLDDPLPITRGMPIELDVETFDGRAWRWRGRAGAAEFDQTTWLSRPPCIQ